MFASPQQSEEKQTFIIGYQQGTINESSLELLRLANTKSSRDKILEKLHFETKEYEPGIVFIFPSLSRLTEYIKQKKLLMDLFIEKKAGQHLTPWTSAPNCNQLPKYWFDELNTSTKTVVNTRLSIDTPFIPQLRCKLSLTLGEKDITIDISMERPISNEFRSKLRSLASLEGGVNKEEKQFPPTHEAAVAQYPFVSFTLAGLELKVWGSSYYNSKAAKYYEAYFHDLRLRSEKLEEELRALYSEFSSSLASSDPLWREIVALKGQKSNSLSSELNKLTLDALMFQPGKRFASSTEANTFLNSATVSKVTPMLELFVPTINHLGSMNLYGLEF